ncbi:MAG: hypothetical protein NVS4B2_26900 [Chloroflexota bacterium]
MSTDEWVESPHPAPEAPQRPYRYYALFIAVYNALFGVFLLLYRRSREPLAQVSSLDVALLGMATLRLSKAISEDEITQVVREPLVDQSGDQASPQGEGLRYALGKLILCPTCTGTWVAALLTYALHLFPRQTRPFLAVMSASGISQFSDALLSLVYTDRDTLRKQARD